MSKDKKRNVQPATEAELTPDVSTPTVEPVNNLPPVPVLKLMDIDKMALDLAKERRKTVLAEARTALANNENAELAFKYTVLQIYMKYSLTENDAISENGEIIKNGAAPQKS